MGPTCLNIGPTYTHHGPIPTRPNIEPILPTCALQRKQNMRSYRNSVASTPVWAVVVAKRPEYSQTKSQDVWWRFLQRGWRSRPFVRFIRVDILVHPSQCILMQNDAEHGPLCRPSKPVQLDARPGRLYFVCFITNTWAAKSQESGIAISPLGGHAPFPKQSQRGLSKSSRATGNLTFLNLWWVVK